MTERPLVAYEPNALLAWLYHRFFEHITLDETWASAVREADRRGTVVYVLRNLSFVDFFALDHLTKRLELPRIRFANDLGLWVLEPMGRGWFEALKKRPIADDTADLERAIREGASAALFLKRPPTLLEPAARGRIEGDAFLRKLLTVQRTIATPILLVPQVFVWTKIPDEQKHNAFDAVLGPREWPGKIRTLAQFLANYRNVTLRAGEPLSVRAFLESEDALAESRENEQKDPVLVRRMTYLLLRRLERERRAVIGPAKKPNDRLRAEVVRSPKLQKIIGDMAGEGVDGRRVLTERALAMVKEMEAAPDLPTVTAIDTALEQFLSRAYDSIEVDEAGFAKLREAAKDGTLVLLPSHKSHVDYLILSYIFFHRHMPVPITAAGDNLNFFPVGALLRRAGAFYIRRSFHGDRLYGAVVDAYVRRLLKDGWPLAFFLEGGRSRSGKLLPPKLGLLSIVVDAVLQIGPAAPNADAARGRKVYFCPVSIGYERVVEESAFVHELTGGEKSKEDVRGIVKSLGLIVQRYGRLNVQFGTPLTLAQVLAQAMQEEDPNSTPGDEGEHERALGRLTPAKRRGLVQRLAFRVMHEINRVTAVTPGALVATALLTHGQRGIAHPDLVLHASHLARILAAFGARFTPSLEGLEPGTIREEAIREACDLFAKAGHVEVREPGTPVGTSAGTRDAPRSSATAVYVVPDSARLSLDISKNIVLHFFVPRALVALAILAAPSGVSAVDVNAAAEGPVKIPKDAARERVRTLSRLFKYEFQFRADAPFEQIFEDTVDEMARAREITVTAASSGYPEGGLVAAGAGLETLRLYAGIVQNFVESYRIAARGLSLLLRGPLTPKDLARRSIAVGERMFLAAEIQRREAVSRQGLENAALAFVDQGYLRRHEGRYVLSASYETAEAVRTIEAKIALFARPA
jgi:glycerol-3-phosphate O-acyltransferase